jgi:CRP/FNR family transcriptional regulator, dissimilatory nitrate respiration regulator
MPKQTIPLREFLASLPLFAPLEAAAIERLAAGITAIDAPKGTVIVRRGESCQGLHVVVYGTVKLSLQAPRGQEKVIALVGRGETFGESAMFLGRSYRISATTLSDSKLLHLPRALVVDQIVRDPTFSQRIIDSLCKRFAQLLGDVEGCTLRSGTQRVSAYLLEHLPKRNPPEETAVTFPAQKGVIASQLNLTQEHFSRILNELRSAGLIEVQGRVVRVLDGAGLRSRAA